MVSGVGTVGYTDEMVAQDNFVAQCDLKNVLNIIFWFKPVFAASLVT